MSRGGRPTPDLWVASFDDLDGEAADDAALDAELAAAGVHAVRVAWDDPEVVWEDARGVLIRTTWGYHRRIDAFRAWLDLLDATGVAVQNATSVVRANTDKRYLAELAAAGVAIVPTTFVAPDDVRTLREVLDAAGLDVAVIKPSVSADSDGLAVVGRDRSVDGAAADAAAWAGLKARPAAVLVQPLLASLASDAAGETSLMLIGGELTHAVRKRPAAGDIRVQPNHGGRVEACEPSAAELDVVAQVRAALGDLPLIARIDVAPDADGVPLLMELELVEPELFFRIEPSAAFVLASRVAEWLDAH